MKEPDCPAEAVRWNERYAEEGEPGRLLQAFGHYLPPTGLGGSGRNGRFLPAKPLTPTHDRRPNGHALRSRRHGDRTVEGIIVTEEAPG
jgi:hypothetical protein